MRHGQVVRRECVSVLGVAGVVVLVFLLDAVVPVGGVVAVGVDGG